jgi:hypothetical protein
MLLKVVKLTKIQIIMGHGVLEVRPQNSTNAAMSINGIDISFAKY